MTIETKPTTHTPGPLIQYGVMVPDTTDTTGGLYCIQQAVTTPRGTVVGNGHAIGYAKEKPDAVLFAAATELLEACACAEQLLRTIAEWSEEGWGTDALKAADKCRAVIAKAEGR